MEPGNASPVAELLFGVLVFLLFAGVVFAIVRSAFLMSLLWIMPVARVLSFIPGVRGWIERKTAEFESDAET